MKPRAGVTALQVPSSVAFLLGLEALPRTGMSMQLLSLEIPGTPSVLVRNFCVTPSPCRLVNNQPYGKGICTARLDAIMCEVLWVEMTMN